MKRKKFLHTVLASFIILISPVKNKAELFVEIFQRNKKEYLRKIYGIINFLKSNGSNLVLKIMNGKKYKFDSNVHYPYDGGIFDSKTKSRVFFHAHRKNEYGHFHTFVEDEKGNLIHLILISMNKQGEPIGLSTVNRWVTGDTYFKAGELKKYFLKFNIDKTLFKEEKVLLFIENIFKAYQDEIFKLFDERDKWIQNYVNKYYNEPFEDRNYEILSSIKINIFKNLNKRNL